MNTHFSQADRQGRLTTALGSDALVLLRMDGVEELSGDFEWQVEALSIQGDVDLHQLLGTHASVEIKHAGGVRAFDGIVVEAEARGAFENGFRYDLTLRPWLHVAGLRRNMRIFHNKTVVQIVEEVLSAYSGLGNPHLDVQLTSSYPELEYTVQYGESDANFVKRQLERHGISWSWVHQAGNHTLLLTDAAFSLPEVPDKTRPYYSVDGFHQHDEEHFSLWSPGDRMTTGAVRLTEYNFKTPKAAQEVDRDGDASHPSGDIESYDWPGDYLNQGEGRDVVKRRIDAERGQAPRHRATGDVVSLGAGWRVTLVGDDVPGATGQTFTCLKATHRFRAQGYGSGGSQADETPYEGDYILMPEDTPFRPERRTIGPRVQGPETAVVVGEGEIDCDEYGRILCRFHWDLDAAHTMRVRVSQNWASKGWGGMVIPRIGMEVIVEHLRGDPDKPIVTGCVYNGKNMPPYELPEHKTRSTFKTNTHGAGEDGFNEIRFEDEKGEEEIFIHAQKDRNEKIRNNHTERIDNNWVQSVGQHKVVEVDGNHSEAIHGSMSLHVGGSGVGRVLSKTLRRLTEGISDIANRLPVPGLFGLGSGTFSLYADKAVNVVTPGVKTENIGIMHNTMVGRNISQQAGNSIQSSAGATLTMSAGETVVLNANSDVHIVCGKSQIFMTSDGYIRMAGDTLFLNFENGIEAAGGKQIQLNADRIDLN